MHHTLQLTLSRIVIATLLLGLITSFRPALAQNARSLPSAWTLAEAQAQLRLHPEDAYLQYVALQLARRAGRLDEVAAELERLTGAGRRAQMEARRAGVDLFSLFTGALAVQESLQLDAMRAALPGDEPRPRPFYETNPELKSRIERDPQMKQVYDQQWREQLAEWEKRHVEFEKRRRATVNVASLTGPTIKSHPWAELLAGRQPALSPLARLVPLDFYFIEFRSLSKLLDALETSDLWTAHLFNQVYREARTPRVGDRLKQQLALETDARLKPFYDLAVEDVAVAGSDPFLREGSDVSLLFRVKATDVFQFQMEKFLANAAAARPDAKRSTGKYLDVEYAHLTTPDRAVHVFAATPAPGLHLRSSSLPAFQRMIEAIKGRNARGQAVERLGESAEFAYIRTLMPTGAPEEDGFIYLSDPFIRRLMSPQLKLTERRRVLCYNHLRMIAHAALLYRTETGRAPASLAEIVKAQCAPGTFGEAALACPDGGRYSLGPDGLTGVCSHHGNAQSLTPCLEIPVTQVSGVEADEYQAFLEEYNQYWRTFFDPIALRLRVTPKQYRLETVILPLIDNSIYTSLARTLGGQPEALDALPVPRRNIFSVALRLDKNALLAPPSAETLSRQRDLPPEYRRTNPLGFAGLSDTTAEQIGLKDFLDQGLGNQLSLHVYDAHPTFDLNLPELMGMMAGSMNGRASGFGGIELLFGAAIVSLNSPVYLALPVQDTQRVDQFLERVDALLAVEARTRTGVSFLSLDEDFYRFDLKQGQSARSFALRFGPIKLRLFWARIGNGLYLASKAVILDDLATAEAERTGAAATSLFGSAANNPSGHAMARIRPQNWNQVLTDFQLGWAENNREACLNNLGSLSSIGRAFTAAANTPQANSRAAHEFADRLQAVHSFCPEGGEYQLSPDGRAFACSVHGTAQQPRQPIAPADASELGRLMRELKDVTATLTFLPEGLRAVVTIERK